MKEKINKILSIILIPVFMVFIISSSILVPLIDRNFYYIQIDNLKIEEKYNLDRETIIEAYDDVLDFIWKNKEFKTGKLKFSLEGKSHFEDCKKLFHLDLIAFIISTSLLIIFFILKLLKIVDTVNFKGLSPIFYSSIFLLSIILIIVVFAVLDFDTMFTLFHKVFFPGKDNWQFYPNKDQVILILDEKYFMRCGLVIAGMLILETSLSIIYSLIKRKSKRDL